MSNVLLQLMDEGFVTGSNGKRADARNCFIIPTTNLGSADAENTIGFGDLNPELKQKHTKSFLSEFRNRIDPSLYFWP